MTTSKSIRRATAEDVPVLTQIRNDAHAKKSAHRDYAWGKEGDGFSEEWVLTSLSRREVYVVEQDGMQGEAVYRRFCNLRDRRQ